MDRDAIIASMEHLETWAMVFTFLVAIGVAGEFFVGFKQRRLSKLLRVADDTHALAQEALVQAARADALKAAAEVASATFDIEDAKRAAAEANARAAEANQKAEEERLARVKIEERLAPRVLTQADVGSLVVKLKSFPGTQVAMFVANGNEPTALANTLMQALETAGWKLSATQGDTGGDSGIVVELTDNADAEAGRAAQALADGLSGILQTTGPIPSRNLTRMGIGRPSYVVTKPTIALTIAPK